MTIDELNILCLEHLINLTEFCTAECDLFCSKLSNILDKEHDESVVLHAAIELARIQTKRNYLKFNIHKYL